MPTTDQDARALTYLAGRLRTETHGARTWDDTGTFAVIKTELVGLNLAHAIEQILCHATDPDAKTPGAIRRNFTPPKPSERPGQPPSNPTAPEVCRVVGHEAYRATNCIACATKDVPETPVSPDLVPLTDRDPSLAARLARITNKETPA